MKISKILAVLSFILAGCVARESVAKPRPGAALDSIRISDSNRWLQFTAFSDTLVIAKIADAERRPARVFTLDNPYEGKGSRANAGKTLFHLYIPNTAPPMKAELITRGRREPLPKPMKVFRMSNSVLSTSFLAAPKEPFHLVLKTDMGTKTVRVDRHWEALWSLPFFWSGDPSTVAEEELPPWMSYHEQ